MHKFLLSSKLENNCDSHKESIELFYVLNITSKLLFMVVRFL